MSIAGGLETGAARGIAGRFWKNAAGGARRLFSKRRRGVKPRAILSHKRTLAAGAAIVVGIVLLLLFADASSIRWQRSLPPSAFAAFSFISEFGRSVWFLLPTALALIVIAALASPRIGRMPFLALAAVSARLSFVFTAVALPSLVVSILKRLIGRERPELIAFKDPLSFQPLSWDSAMASLPSGHATTAFAAAMALAALFPRLLVPIWATAVAIAISRVALSVHYPSDVFAGAIVGVLGARLVRNWFAAQGLAFAIGPDGVVRTLPGPSRGRLARSLRAMIRG